MLHAIEAHLSRWGSHHSFLGASYLSWSVRVIAMKVIYVIPKYFIVAITAVDVEIAAVIDPKQKDWPLPDCPHARG